MESSRRISRRRVLQAAAAGLLGGAGASSLYALRIEPHWIKVHHQDLPMVGLPARLVGKILVHLSDLHVGPVVDSNYLSAALELVESLGPDLTVITGDFMHCTGTERVAEVSRLFQNFDPGPLGCLAVLGNHDYGKGWVDTEAADRLCQTLERQGVNVLRDASTEVAGLQVIGLEDLWGPRFHPETFLRSVDWDRPTLALCHNPDAVDLPIWEGFRGWTLSGHTHGGQCKPPFLPPPILPVKNKRYTRGAFDLAEGRSLYVNPGLGYLKRVRFNVRPEVTAFRLTTPEGTEKLSRRFHFSRDPARLSL
ncbi:MAG: metallophosphoesterase [Isosphaeraceae bacterium]